MKLLNFVSTITIAILRAELLPSTEKSKSLILWFIYTTIYVCDRVFKNTLKLLMKTYLLCWIKLQESIICGYYLSKIVLIIGCLS